VTNDRHDNAGDKSSHGRRSSANFEAVARRAAMNRTAIERNTLQSNVTARIHVLETIHAAAVPVEPTYARPVFSNTTRVAACAYWSSERVDLSGLLSRRGLPRMVIRSLPLAGQRGGPPV
jgi:hypothetical protein